MCLDLWPTRNLLTFLGLDLAAQENSNNTSAITYGTFMTDNDRLLNPYNVYAINHRVQTLPAEVSIRVREVRRLHVVWPQNNILVGHGEGMRK